VVIPKEIFDALGLRTGDFVEVQKVKGTVVITPKKLVDADDVLTPREEALVRKGEAQLRRGEYVTLEDLEHELDRPTVTRRRKTT
jgi:AbrB family looped-hinge helix DNA binding protein